MSVVVRQLQRCRVLPLASAASLRQLSTAKTHDHARARALAAAAAALAGGFAISKGTLCEDSTRPHVAVPRLQGSTVSHCSSPSRRILPNELLSDGSLAGTYEVFEELGSGAYATVFRAVDRSTGVRRAVKKQKKPKGGAMEESFLLSEVAILRHLSRDQRTVQLVDCYEDDDFVYFVLELCYGADVLDWCLLQDSISENHWAVLLKEMLLSIAECHAKGIVHLDVKPENFMTTSAFTTQMLNDAASASSKDSHEPILKLADFGLSRYFDMHHPFEKLLHPDSKTAVVGTFTYMAPECMKYLDFSPKCDVWSLGVTAFALMTGKYPFNVDEQTEKPEAIQDLGSFSNHVGRELTKVGVGPHCADLIKQMLEHDQKKRISIDEALKHPFFTSGNELVSTVSKRKAALRQQELELRRNREQMLRKTKAFRMREITLKPGEVLFQKGDVGDSVYFLRAGQVEVLDGDIHLATVPPGGIVGEMAAMLGKPRCATVRCAQSFESSGKGKKSSCELLSIPNDALPHLKDAAPLELKRFRELADRRDVENQANAWLEGLPMFSGSSKEFLRRLSQRMQPESLQKNDVLITQGSIGEDMFILRSGSLEVIDTGVDPRGFDRSGPSLQSFPKIDRLRVGSVVGEIALMDDSDRRSFTVVALNRAELLRLTRKDFVDLLDYFPDEKARFQRIADERRQSWHDRNLK